MSKEEHNPQWTMAYQLNRNWRLKNPDKYRRQQKRRAKKGSRRNHKQPWTDIERNMLFDFEGTDVELSTLIGRSPSAIQKMRSLMISKHKSREALGVEDPTLPSKVGKYRERPQVLKYNLRQKPVQTKKRTMADDL